jgi:uncharacterized membrane protein YgcG
MRTGSIDFRGWHCARCFPNPKSADQVYLVCAIHRKEVVCQQCKKPAVKETLQKKKQALHECAACGHRRTFSYADAGSRTKASNSAGYTGGSCYSPTTDSSSSSSYDSNNTWDNSPSYDPPDSGGSTSGGGASDNW